MDRRTCPSLVTRLSTRPPLVVDHWDPDLISLAPVEKLMTGTDYLLSSRSTSRVVLLAPPCINGSCNGIDPDDVCMEWGHADRDHSARTRSPRSSFPSLSISMPMPRFLLTSLSGVSAPTKGPVGGQLIGLPAIRCWSNCLRQFELTNGGSQASEPSSDSRPETQQRRSVWNCNFGQARIAKLTSTC